ncbi:MAG: endo-1,4-beta-xylanase [Kiritimatiellae bacterium]|nr:endo-1,4-beta-xylanase [Kiritimatiellia bacterium]
MRNLAAILIALPTLSIAATVSPKATDSALINPDMGWVYYKYSNRLWAYGINTPENDTLDWFPGCSTIYMRVLWNDVEPEEGKFRWDIFDSAAQNWIAKGKKIAIRIICCNQTETAVPQFVRDAGAQGFWFEYATDTVASGKLPPRWEPKYDDPVFLEKLSNFLRAFARRYDGDPNVAFVDIGSYGIYGEGHHYGTTQEYLGDPDGTGGRDVRAENVRLAKIHLDLWRKFLPNTYLVVSDDLDGGWSADEQELMPYCRENGIGFRDDSIFCFPPPGTHPKCRFSYWAHGGWARKFAPTLPVVLETGHAAFLESTPMWDEESYVRCVEEHQASYMSIHDFPDEHLRRHRGAIDRINKMLGYRFELREATWPDAVKIGEEVEIASSWVNVGVAPKTKGAALTWSLLNPDGSVAWSVTDDSFDFSALAPKLKGAERPLFAKTVCRFGFEKRIPEPDNCVVWARKAGRTFPDVVCPLKPGVYDLAVSVGSWQGTPEIALPLEGEVVGTRRYRVGKIAVEGRRFEGDPMSAEYRKLWGPSVQSAIDGRIEKFRKADAALGGFKPGTTVEVEQLTHDFKFGAHIFNFDQLGSDAANDIYKATFTNLLNAATVAYYWSNYEPERGSFRHAAGPHDSTAFWNGVAGLSPEEKYNRFVEYRRPAPDPILDFCERNGISVHGHAMVYRAYEPKWVSPPGAADADVLAAYRRHIRELAEHCGRRVTSWDVVNESVRRDATPDAPDDSAFWGQPEKYPVPAGYTLECFREAARSLPDGVRAVINEACTIDDLYLSFVKSLLGQGAKIDAVGLQYHIFDPAEMVDLAHGVHKGRRGYNYTPKRIMRTLENADRLGLPIHISEITVPAPEDTPWGEAVQAEALRDLYRLWFSWPSVYRITYWNLVDYTYHKESLASGFYGRGMRRKPVLDVLESLVNKTWKTRLSLTAADDGSVSFRGFRGKYRVRGTDAGGRSVEKEFRVK